ncbi:MAG TPA: hypothetical protein VHS09_15625 [Polyangiaceae bacterium]|nr:hypothetical protein [Polyangiaceae bacterium]
MRPPRFVGGEAATLRSRQTTVYIVELAPPPFQALSSAEPHYRVRPEDELFEGGVHDFVVAQGDLEPVPRAD